MVPFLDKEVSSDEEYQAEGTDEEYEDEEEEEEEEAEREPQNRRSSAAKRKSVAISAKEETESYGNYRNTIDNGPVPGNGNYHGNTCYDFALCRACVNIE